MRRHFTEIYPEMSSKDGFKCGFNPTFRDGGGEGHGWISKGYCGLDQAPAVLVIEIYRPGVFWRLMRQCPSILMGLRRAGLAVAGCRARAPE
jgi:hypothetical protein